MSYVIGKQRYTEEVSLHYVRYNFENTKGWREAVELERFKLELEQTLK